jgi:hypothetical protein
MKKLISNNLLVVMGIVFGGIGGWMYWYFIGCASGTCPITSHPLNSSIYGMAMGGLFFSILKK